MLPNVTTASAVLLSSIPITPRRNRIVAALRLDIKAAQTDILPQNLFYLIKGDGYLYRVPVKEQFRRGKAQPTNVVRVFHHGQLVKVAVPVSELTQFAVITTRVPVATSPTLVIIDPKGQASTMTGWASQGEIAMRIADAALAQ